MTALIRERTGSGSEAVPCTTMTHSRTEALTMCSHTFLSASSENGALSNNMSLPGMTTWRDQTGSCKRSLYCSGVRDILPPAMPTHSVSGATSLHCGWASFDALPMILPFDITKEHGPPVKSTASTLPRLLI